MRYIVLFIGLFVGKGLWAQELQWLEVQSIGIDQDHPALIKVTQDGKKYHYHLESKVLIDKIEDRAADLIVGVKDGQYGVIHENGKLLLPFEYDEIKLITKYHGQWFEGIPYVYKFIVLRKNSLYGFADEKGKIIAQPRYTDIRAISKNIIGYKENNLWGWLDAQSGQVLQSPEYENITQFLNDDHIGISKSDRVGLARKDGTILIPVEHPGYLRYIYTKQHKYIQADKPTPSGDQNKRETILYDTLGNILLDGFDAITTIHGADFVTFKRDDRIGAVDPTTGEVVIQPIYTQIKDGLRGLFIVEQNNLFGVIDEKGEIIVPVSYTDIKFMDIGNNVQYGSSPMISAPVAPKILDERQQALRKRREFITSQPYFIQVRQDNYVSIFDWQGQAIVPIGKYRDIVPKFHKSVFFLTHNTQNKNLEILDSDGKKLFEAPYALDRTYKYSAQAIENNWALSDRYLSLQQNQSDDNFDTQICLFDLEKGKVVVPMANQYIEWLDQNHLKVNARQSKNKISLYNQEAELIIAFDEPIYDLFVVGVNQLLLKEDDKYRLVDMQGKLLYQNPNWGTRSGFAARRFPEYKGKNTGDYHHGLMKLYMREANIFVDESGKEVTFEPYVDVDNFYTGTAIATIEIPDSSTYRGYSYRYGLIDTKGVEIHPMVWENVSPFQKNPDILLVQKDEKWGLVDRTGKLLLDHVYDHIETSSAYPNLTVQKNSKQGLLSEDGTLLLEPRYEQLRRNYKGEEQTWPLLVKEDEWYYFINKQGNPFPIRAKQQQY